MPDARTCAVRTCKSSPASGSARGLCLMHDGQWKISLCNTRPDLVNPKPTPDRAFMIWRVSQELADAGGDTEKLRKLYEGA